MRSSVTEPNTTEPNATESKRRAASAQPAVAVGPQQWPPTPKGVVGRIDGFILAWPKRKLLLSGLAVGALCASIGSTLMLCIAVIAFAFEGIIVTGVFSTSAVLFGVGALVCAVYARRDLRTTDGTMRGKGLASTGQIIAVVTTSVAALLLTLSFVL